MLVTLVWYFALLCGAVWCCPPPPPRVLCAGFFFVGCVLVVLPLPLAGCGALCCAVSCVVSCGAAVCGVFCVLLGAVCSFVSTTCTIDRPENSKQAKSTHSHDPYRVSPTFSQQHHQKEAPDAQHLREKIQRQNIPSGTVPFAPAQHT